MDPRGRHTGGTMGNNKGLNPADYQFNPMKAGEARQFMNANPWAKTVICKSLGLRLSQLAVMMRKRSDEQIDPLLSLSVRMLTILVEHSKRNLTLAGSGDAYMLAVAMTLGIRKSPDRTLNDAHRMSKGLELARKILGDDVFAAMVDGDIEEYHAQDDQEQDHPRSQPGGGYRSNHRSSHNPVVSDGFTPRDRQRQTR